MVDFFGIDHRNYAGTAVRRDDVIVAIELMKYTARRPSPPYPNVRLLGYAASAARGRRGPSGQQPYNAPAVMLRRLDVVAPAYSPSPFMGSSSFQHHLAVVSPVRPSARGQLAAGRAIPNLYGGYIAIVAEHADGACTEVKVFPGIRRKA